MLLGVIGINHKLANLSLREALANACQRHFAIINEDHSPHRFVLLSTCNRTEVYFHSESLADAQSYVIHILRNEVHEEFDQKLYSFFGIDCFYHLCRVTAGLDSAVIGETEIQGQVKSAYEGAAAQGRIPGIVHFAFQKSLKVGKTVRSNIHMPAGMPSLEQAIFTIGRNHFKDQQDPKILFVGASYINGKVLEYFQRRGFNNISISNRSTALAEEWSNKYGIATAEWNNRENWLSADWLIFGTRSPRPLLMKSIVPDQKECLIIDLSVPRNVDPSIGQLQGMTLYNIDQINRTLRMRQNKARCMIESAEIDIAAQCKRLVESYHNKTAIQELVVC